MRPQIRCGVSDNFLTAIFNFHGFASAPALYTSNQPHPSLVASLRVRVQHSPRQRVVGTSEQESREREGAFPLSITVTSRHRLLCAAMAKPSILQKFLGRPSQTYELPSPKHYYSDKPAMMRIATEARQSMLQQHDTPLPPALEDQLSQDEQEEDDDDDDDDADTDLFYTPRSSIASDTSMSITMTSPPTSDAGHTDQDWTKDLEWLATAIQKPKRKPLPIPPPRSSRSPAPSIMMSMTTLLEEDEDGPPVPPKRAPPSSVIVSSRSGPAPHRRARSHGTSATSTTLSSVHLPPLPSGPPELPSYGTPAYTSLEIPLAPASTTSLSRSSSISQRLRATLRRDPADLSRSRLAQVTMASVEVVGGLAAPSHNQPPRLAFTHYRAPPSVPKAGVLVQVWAVGLDVVDIRLLGGHAPAHRSDFTRTRTQSFGRFVGRTISRRTASDVSSINDDKEPSHAAAQVGFIPGRSFVGRVLECGWEVRDEVVRRGEWVVGLLDIRKSGALAEFITVDRHRIHRVPHPQIPQTVPSGGASTPSSPSATPPSSTSSDVFPISHQNQDSPYPSRPSSVSFTHDTPPPSRPSSRPSSRPPSRQHRRISSAPPLAPPSPPSLSLTELALLPLGLAAYRTVRTLSNVATPISTPNPSTWARDAVTPDGELADPFNDKARAPSVQVNARGAARRALVLHGHTGTGGLVARMLTRRGWRVCVHAPGSLVEGGADVDPSEEDKQHMRRVQARARSWGVEEVVFDDGGAMGEDGDGGRGAAVRAVERLIGDGDSFDAIVDTIGGRELWEAGERLLAENGGAGQKGVGRRKQFTTTVGDYPARPIPSAKDNFRAGLRSLRGNQNEGKKSKKENKKEKAAGGRSEVGYAWVSSAQDVDWEGEDVRDSIAAVLRMALEDGVRPFLEEERVPLPFERAAEVFETRDGGVMRGGNVVVRVAG
ncbi:hypothetical protein B0H16DRAFT_247074 [Mycena metata]|uniref:Uncharacterized protein n=1 Tax=Mycena metata TaxID=1033252 RepID=A0AAD7HTG7_9AGAR|nr:hypothetical protein B0H16DRAFT_247074 [Mycena metata]